MPNTRATGAGTVGPDGKWYFFGGISSIYTTNVDVYDPCTNTWSPRAPTPSVHHGSPSAITAPNGLIYYVGGEGDTTVEAYDPATDTWSTKAPMQQARGDFGLAVGSDGRIYAVGGVTGQSEQASVEAYDTAKNTWTYVASMSTARLSVKAIADSSGKIYAIGGGTWGCGVYATGEVYNPATNTWSAIASMPTPNYTYLATYTNTNKIYVIGGEAGSGCQNAASTNVMEYDVASNTWTQRAPIVHGVRSGQVAQFGDMLLIAGAGDGAAPYAPTQEYDLTTFDAATTCDPPASIADMPTPRGNGAGAIGPDGKLYSISGEASSGFVNNVDVYDPCSDTWSSAAALPDVPDWGPAAVTGPDRLIYFAGGYLTNEVQVFDPKSNTWSKKAAMNHIHDNFNLVVGPDQRIYAPGGRDSDMGSATLVEAYDTKTDTWTDVASMATARFYASAVVAGDGRIYVTGGGDASCGIFSAGEAYDAKTDTWSPIASMPTAQEVFGTSYASNGKIYVFGGEGPTGCFGGAVSMVQVYDVASNTWSTATSMPTAEKVQQTVAPLGTKLVNVGGFNGSAWSGAMQPYDYVSNSW